MSLTETNGHHKPFNLPACRASLPDSPLASAEQQQEESTYACGRLVTQDGISVHVNPVGGLGGHVAAWGIVVLKRCARVRPRGLRSAIEERAVNQSMSARRAPATPRLRFVGWSFAVPF